MSTSPKINAFKKALAKSARFTDSSSATLTAPTAPTNLVASATGSTAVSLSWNASSAASSYTVRRNGTAVGTATGTSYTDTGLAASTTYTYTVSASNSAGTSGASNTATATTNASGSTASTLVAFRASATVSANATSATVTVPSQVQPGDTMVLFVSTNTGSAPSATASGWTKVGEQFLTDLRTEMWTRVAAVGDVGKAVTIDLPVTSKVDVTLVAYSGATAARPISASASRADSVNSVQHQSPGLTLPDSSSVVLSYWVDRSSATTSWTVPSGQVKRAQNVGSGSGRLTSVASDLGKASPSGTWAPVTATANAASSRTTIWSVALTSASEPKSPSRGWRSGCVTARTTERRPFALWLPATPTDRG